MTSAIATAGLSAVEDHLVIETLRRGAILQPLVAMVLAEALSADEQELDGLASLLVPEDAELTLRLLGEVLAEAAGGCA
jgi:hypothetical protein